MMESAVVTGGAGFIGSHIVDALVGRGVRTTVVDDLSSGSLDHVNPAADFIEADVSEPAAIELIAAARAEVVVHAAAQVSVPVSTMQPEVDRRINLVGTENVLAAARRGGCRRFVFISSGGAIYGEATMATEVTLPNPANPYGIHKLAAEGYVRTSGLSFAIARYSNVYGPRQRKDLEGGVVAIFVDRLAGREPITIYGSGAQSRDFLYVEDAAAATLAMADASVSGTWNVSTGAGISIRELLAELERLIAPAVSVLSEPRRPGDVDVSSLSYERLQAQLGWRPRYPLSEGLERTVDASGRTRGDAR